MQIEGVYPDPAAFVFWGRDRLAVPPCWRCWAYGHVVGDGSLAVAVAELALYVAVTVVATWGFERRLLREVLGYLRARSAAAPAAA